MIQVLKEEQNKMKASYEKQTLALNEQCLQEKNEIKAVCLLVKQDEIRFY